MISCHSSAAVAVFRTRQTEFFPGSTSDGWITSWLGLVRWRPGHDLPGPQHQPGGCGHTIVCHPRRHGLRDHLRQRWRRHRQCTARTAMGPVPSPGVYRSALGRLARECSPGSPWACESWWMLPATKEPGRKNRRRPRDVSSGSHGRSCRTLRLHRVRLATIPYRLQQPCRHPRGHEGSQITVEWKRRKPDWNFGRRSLLFR